MKVSHIPQAPKDNKKKDYGFSKKYLDDENLNRASKKIILTKKKNKYIKKHHIDEFLLEI